MSSFEDTLDCQKNEQVGPRSNQASSIFMTKILMLKLSYFVHIVGRHDSMEKTMMLGMWEAAGKEGGQVS